MAASDTEASLILSLGKCLDIAFSRSRTLLLFWSGELSSEAAEAGLGVAEAGLRMLGGDTGASGLLSPG